MFFIRHLSLICILMLSCMLELFVETGLQYMAQVFLNATLLLFQPLGSGTTDIYTVSSCNFILTASIFSQLLIETVLSYSSDTSKGSFCITCPHYDYGYMSRSNLYCFCSILLRYFIKICIDILYIQSFKLKSLLLLILTFPHYLR